MHALSLCRLGDPGSEARVPDTQAAELRDTEGGGRAICELPPPAEGNVKALTMK